MSPRRKRSDSSTLVFIALTTSTHRCRQRISSHLHVLYLIALGIKETIANNYGSPILEVIR
jgi:hypothetical protein